MAIYTCFFILCYCLLPTHMFRGEQFVRDMKYKLYFDMCDLVQIISSHVLNVKNLLHSEFEFRMVLKFDEKFMLFLIPSLAK